MEITKESYSYRITWEQYYYNDRLIDRMWDWADKHIGPKNFRYRDMNFYFDNESDAIMFRLRWSQ
jgi:hypothetical protein